ncbi:uncharacterized protein Z518_02034 [Rhinocladiella mackenziei CBS 650.93]|uniref:Uncharacterized protein n=1 Tax=Rhinocladiella mackenziei CBS 650.93 TaxID=1442369 RepID=A0A0D2IVX5_9EURO|nr:uncharacterized protein Z518_02034 [Rhinocladiella mackenziei CBS 650.93]KIX07381.1 hypothetical protein Z518_02034 [Rhinocladiella mackenziei CBS 650.93]
MSAKPRHGQTQPRKSLKQSLKDVFLRRPRKSPNPSLKTVGSGILRKADPSTSSIPWLDAASSCGDWAVSQLSLDDFTISRSIPNRFETPTRKSTVHRQSLLPATSLSQFNLHHAYLQPSTVPRRAVHEVISPSFTSIVSREASLATLSAVSSASTLRLQESRQKLLPRDALQDRTIRSSARTATDRQSPSNQVSWLHSPTVSSGSVRDIVSRRGEPLEPDDPAGVRLVEHFRSFCILDTVIPGCPVVATSQELRYIFEIGEHFFLNSCECEGTSMDIVTGQDAAGDPVTHLVLFTPLIIPSSGRSRFMLASLIDVTRFIHDTASLPELERSSNSSTIESDLRTPMHDRLPSNWNSARYKLSAEDLLGGCVLPEDREVQPHPLEESPDDVWLNLADEERSRTSTARNTPRSTPKISQTPGSSKASHSSTAASTVDEVLEEFIRGLQELYSDFFLLGKSPLDDTFYEICNVSPLLYAAKDYIHGHLSHTGQHKIAELSTRLAQGSPFNMHVKWGLEGLDKRLYCSPLYGQNSITWICFLVDHRIPTLW